MKTVDILIPTYKPGKQFIELIHALQKQLQPVHKIIVMNTEARFWDEAVCRYPELQGISNLEVYHISQMEFDHAATRDTAMKLSDADICVCMTQDAIPYDENMLAHLITPLEDEMVVVSYARQLPSEDAGAVEAFTRSFNYPPEPRRKTLEDVETLGIKAFFCSDVCAAYNRTTYEKLGGFIAPAIFNEDMIFAAGAIKSGYAVYYAAEAKVVHSHNYTFMQQLRRNFDLAVSQAMHPEVFEGVSSEKEGKKMVLATCKHLIKVGKPFQIVRLVLQSGAKYIGYFLGKRYEKLSPEMINYLTGTPMYWKRNER